MSILTGETHTSVLQKCGTEIRKPCFDHIFITEKQVHSVRSWMEYSPAVFIRFLTNFREQVKSSLQIPGIGFSTQQKCYITIIWIQMMPVIPCVILWWPEMKRCVLWFKHHINVRCQISDNCSGKQHSTCFSTNHTCSDHMISNIKIILWRKVLFQHSKNVIWQSYEYRWCLQYHV